MPTHGHPRTARARTQARRGGLEPDVVMYTMKLTALCHMVDLRGAVRVFQEMRSAGQHPDAVTYKALLHACAKAADGYKALEVLDEMHEYAIPVDLSAYNSALKACVVAGLDDQALEMFAMLMQHKRKGEDGLAPSRATFTIIMQHYAAAGDAQAAEAMLQVMTREHEIPPDARCFMVVLEACAQAASLLPVPGRAPYKARALAHLQAALDSLGPLLSSVDKERLLTKTVAVYAQCMDVAATEDLLARFDEEALAPSPQTFAELINLHERCGDGEAALRRLQGMIAQGLVPSPNFIGRAAAAMLRAGDAARALALFAAAARDGLAIHHFNGWSTCHRLLGVPWQQPSAAGGLGGDEWAQRKGEETADMMRLRQALDDLVPLLDGDSVPGVHAGSAGKGKDQGKWVVGFGALPSVMALC